MVFHLFKRENFELLNKLTTNNRGNVSGARYLFKDEFSISISAPLPPLSNASHQGVWATVDVENLMSVSSGVLNVPAQVSAVWGEEYRRAQPSSGQQYWTRPSGKALVAVVDFRQSTRNSQIPVAWWPTSTLNSSTTLGVFTATPVMSSIVNGGGVSDQQSYSASTDYLAIAVWDSTGFHTFVKIAGIWHKKWFTPSSVTQAYCGMSNFNSAGTLKYFRIYAIDESLFAPVLSIANPSVGNLPDMPDGDFLLYLDNITRPSAGNLDVFLRKQDASNYWRERMDSFGSFGIAEVVAGTPTSRISGSGVVSTDDIITIARAQNIQAWRNTTALGSAYTSAYNFLREVGLELNSLGTDGAIGNLYAWKARLLDETGLGADVVVNGDFDTDTDWTKGTGWTISAGAAHKAAGTGSDLTAAVGPLVAGTYYELMFAISNYSGGTLTPKLGSAGQMVGITANGTYTYRGVASATGLIFTANSSFAGSIDNVSCKEIIFTADSLATVLDGLAS